MLNKIKNITSKIDNFFYKKFGTNKSIKPLQNIKEAQNIFSHLNEIDGRNTVRFVGGCVRKVLCGEKVDDIDLATLLKPEEVKERLITKGIKVIDTGISHGTVTAVINQIRFEITTLRKDISTDGRHANVEFTLDWEEDSSRRDFTINAIYADMEGRVFDPQNGISDLQNGRIRFIGSPEKRIQEDYLRILRYFRFFAKYSLVDHEKEVIKTIKQYINGINKISKERIFDELEKTLLIKNFYNIFSNNFSKDIILNIFPQFKYSERIKIINSLEKNLVNQYDRHLILAALILDESNDYEYFCHKYKTSGEIKTRFKNISTNLNELKNKKFYSQENIKRLIYFSNKNYTKDLLLFSIAINKKENISIIEELINFANGCEIPKFPISGDCLKKYGYKTGPELGKKLKSLEQDWVNNNFFIEQRSIDKSLGKFDKN